MRHSMLHDSHNTAGFMRECMENAVESLSEEDFEKFRYELVKRKQKPRVRRNKVEKKPRWEVVEVMISTFKEDKAFEVTKELLRKISCSQEAEDMVEEAMGAGYRPPPPAGGAAGALAAGAQAAGAQAAGALAAGALAAGAPAAGALAAGAPAAGAPAAGAQAAGAPAAGAQAAGAQAAGAQAAEEHFVDRHRLKLIERGTSDPILDALLQEKVLSPEEYDDIRSQPTRQKKMRELYSGPLRAGEEVKDIFYRILKDKEPFLVKSLENQ
ncbi:apoptosis-associated speck-like protein containing a CARD [Odontesthes bonariensis]|uniref:apoptosis-associated speck-like protein containing a CARD n=1 Tax=Odontesthes bonariensis TaxID=219752 RepID=UPI003F58FEF4